MTTKRDYLGECNSQKVPLGDFQMAFCDRCMQPECSRSTHGKSKFDQRTQKWVENLFTNVPRMDPSDPRYREIAAQGFHMIDPSNSASSDWMDPRDLKPETTSIILPSGFIPPPVSPPVEIKEAPAPKVKPNPTQGIPRDILLMNSPGHSGSYLPGAPTKPTEISPKRDPWAVPESSPGEVVVEKGAKIRF